MAGGIAARAGGHWTLAAVSARPSPTLLARPLSLSLAHIENMILVAFDGGHVLLLC